MPRGRVRRRGRRRRRGRPGSRRARRAQRPRSSFTAMGGGGGGGSTGGGGGGCYRRRWRRRSGHVRVPEGGGGGGGGGALLRVVVGPRSWSAAVVGSGVGRELEPYWPCVNGLPDDRVARRRPSSAPACSPAPASMNSFQIVAGKVPPATAIPCTLSIGISPLRIADPDRRLELRHVAGEPGVRVVVGRARSCRRPAGRSTRRRRCRPSTFVLEDLRHLVGDAVGDHALALRRAPARVGVVLAVREARPCGSPSARSRSRPRRASRRRRPSRAARSRPAPRPDRGHDGRAASWIPSLCAIVGDLLRPDVERQLRVDGVVGARASRCVTEIEPRVACGRRSDTSQAGVYGSGW